MKVEAILKELNFNESRTKIYLKLLELKKTTVLQLARETGIYRSTIYDNLRFFIKNGIVSQIIDGSKKYFIPEDPKNLLNILKIKEEKISQALPFLSQLLAQDAARPKIKFYQGTVGIKKLHEVTLNYQSKIIYAIGDYQILETYLSKKYREEYLRQRAKNKIQMKYVATARKKEEIMQNKLLGPITSIKYLREIRIAPQGLYFGVYFGVFDNKVFMFASKKEGYSFLFESDDMAETIRSWFNFLWEISEPYR